MSKGTPKRSTLISHKTIVLAKADAFSAVPQHTGQSIQANVINYGYFNVKCILLSKISQVKGTGKDSSFMGLMNF